MQKPPREGKAEDRIFIQAFEERLETVRTLTTRIQREQARYDRLTKSHKHKTLKEGN